MAALPTTLRKRWRLLTALVAGVVIAAVAAVLVFTGSPPPQHVAYTNISRNFKTCLLSTTDDPTDATRTWQAIQAATKHAAINAQHITAPAGPTTQLLPYANSLVALHCQLIVTTGDTLHDTLITTAQHNPHLHFLNIGTTTSLPNVHTIPTTDTNPTDITHYILTTATH